jgi:hypothetical protein
MGSNNFIENVNRCVQWVEENKGSPFVLPVLLHMILCYYFCLYNIESHMLSGIDMISYRRTIFIK